MKCWSPAGNARSKELTRTLVSGRTRMSADPTRAPSRMPNGWLHTAKTGPSFGTRANSSSEISAVFENSIKEIACGPGGHVFVNLFQSAQAKQLTDRDVEPLQRTRQIGEKRLGKDALFGGV